MLKDQGILITGGAGSIGSELVRQLSINNSVWAIDNNESALFDLVEELKLEGREITPILGDIRDKDVLDDPRRACPSYIFHAAALKHVSPAETNPIEYIKTNVLGSYNVFTFAKKIGARVINISTDKVVNRTSMMGATKKVAELMAKNLGFINVRFGNVLGSRGSVIPIWQKQINQGKELTITDVKMERFMMSIEEAVSLVIKAAEIGEPGNLLILDMGEPVNILDFAKEIIAKSGREIPIKVIGSRPGEVLTETLMTGEEKERAIKQGNFWIIR